MQKENFIFHCRAAFTEGIIPAEAKRHTNAHVNAIYEAAKMYFDGGEIQSFAGYFQEFQYNINLWAAHLLLERRSVPEELRKEALEIIIRYSGTSLNEELARAEKEWLRKYQQNLH